MIKWQERVRGWIPTRQSLTGNRWLRWLAPWLGHPKLWHWSRRGVALGVALGVFFGLLIPLAQIPVTAAAAVLLRANLPVAAASTLVTNPVTFGPVYYAAYRLGSWVTGSEGPARAPEALPASAEQGLWARISGLGRPLLLGLSLMACVGGLTTYVLIDLLWRWRTWSRWRRRRVTGRGL